MKLRELLEHISDENPDREVLINGPGDMGLLKLKGEPTLQEHVKGDKNYLVFFATFSGVEMSDTAPEWPVFYNFVRRHRVGENAQWVHQVVNSAGQIVQDGNLKELLKTVREYFPNLTVGQIKAIKELAKARDHNVRYKVQPWGASEISV